MTIRLPADVLDEVRKIAQATGVRPNEIVVDLCREALRARRGRPRGKQASAAPKVQREPESATALPPFVHRANKLTAPA
jgi:hypothetical protein